MLALVLPLTGRAGGIELTAQADRDQIFLKEHIILTVRVHGVDSPHPPDLSAIADCEVLLLDSRSENSIQAEFVNGQWTRRATYGRTFTYRVTPDRAGKFQAGPVRLTLNGRTIAAPGPTVVVTGVEDQDLVTISVVPSRDTVLVGEVFTVALHVDIRALSGRFADADPLLPREPPALTAPWLSGNRIHGLDSGDIYKLLEALLADPQSEPGFTINSFTIQPRVLGNPFNWGGPAQQPARFRLGKSIVSRDGTARVRYELVTRFEPLKEGNYTFGPLEFKGKVVERVTSSGHAVARSVLAVGPACTVRVVPPPEQGRPESYTGAVGTNFSVHASLDTQTCRVGDPLQLTLTLSGDVSMDNIRAPVLGPVQAIARDFRVYDDAVQSQMQGTNKIYTYTVRPTTAGTIEMPPIEVAYFDAAAGGYRVARTLPIPVRANKVQDSTAVGIIGPATNGPAAHLSLSFEDARVPAPLAFSPEGARPHCVGLTRRDLVVLAVGPGAWLLFLAAGCRRRLTDRWSLTRPRETALRDATRRLTRMPDKDAAPGNAGLVCDAMREYVGRRFGVSPSGVTPADASALLTAHGVNPTSAQRFRALFERNFNAVYEGETPGGGAAPDDNIREALTILSEVDLDTRHAKTLSPRMLMLILVPGLLVADGPRVQAAGQPVEVNFMWEQASAAAAAAVTTEEFENAARMYGQLVDAGIRNGTVFYNMGTCLVKAGRYDEALEALLRAERYAGTTWDIERNMLIAMAGDGDIETVSMPWQRLVLFWHYGLAYRVRLTIAEAGFMILWLCLIFRRSRFRAVANAALTAAAVSLVLFGSSAATSLHQEARANLRTTEFRIE